MTYRSTAKNSFAWAKQPSATKGGLSWGSSMPRSISSTSAGSATTIVSTELSSYGDSNDDFVGWIVKCIRAVNTQNQGLRRRIKSAVDSTNTYTLETALPAATADTDIFELMKPPHLLAVARSAASSTNKRVGTRDRSDTNGRFHGYAQVGGYYLLPINCTRASVTNSRPSTTNLRIVSTNTAASQNIRISTNLGGSVSLGDYFELWKFPAIGGKLLDLNVDMIAKEQIIGTFGRQKSALGNRTAAGSPELSLRGAGPGRDCAAAEEDEALSCVFDVTAGSSDYAGEGSTTSSIVCNIGAQPVGQLLLTGGGHAAMITANAAGTLTVSPALPVAPTAAVPLYGGRTYRPATALRGALSIMQWRSDCILEYAWGCVPTPSFSAERGQFFKVSLPMMVTDWLRLGATGTELARAWTPKLPTIDELKLGVGRLVIDGTELNCNKFSFDPGLVISPKVNLSSPNQTDGYELSNDDPKGSVEIFYDSSERKSIDDFLAGKAVELLVQYGTTPGFPGAIAFYAPKILYTGPAPDEENGLMKLTLPFDITYDPSVTIPRWTLGRF